MTSHINNKIRTLVPRSYLINDGKSVMRKQVFHALAFVPEMYQVFGNVQKRGVIADKSQTSWSLFAL